MTLNLNDCHYCVKAIKDWKGLLVRKWDAKGPSAISTRLGIEPPYFAVPIWSPKGDTLIGFLGADFEDMHKGRRECAIKYLAKDETLVWLRESVGAEVRNALLGAVAESPEALERYKVVQRAGLEVGAAESVDAATAALAKAFRAALPKGCIVSARRKDGDGLVTEEGLCSPTKIETPKVVALTDSKSLAAQVVCTHRRPLWIDNYPRYRKEAIKEGRPPGLSLVSMKSVAHIPISFEGTIYGSLSIDSPNPIRWHEDGLVEPLKHLTPLTALVIREIGLHNRLDRAKARAEADKRAAINFLNNMSHELRTPLTPIIGLSERLAREPGLTPEQQREARIIEQSGRRLLRIINEILDLSKIVAGAATLDPKTFDLHALLDDNMEAFRDEADRKRLSLLLERSGAVPRHVLADETKIDRVLSNLISNAVKFTQKGSVTVRVRAQETPKDGITLYIEVEDTGDGISPEELKQIFEPFLQSTTGRKTGAAPASAWQSPRVW